MKKLLSFIISGMLGLWLATVFIVGVSVKTYPDSSFFGLSLTENWKFFILFGIILGLLNYFVKPMLNAITFPLRIITLGLFGFVINMALIGIVDSIFKELSIITLVSLAWTTLIVWGLNLLLSKSVLTSED
jgi:putative membrane protein